MTSRYLRFDTTGQPGDVLQLCTRELPPLQPHEVRVAMSYAPINPADLNFIEGNYGKPSNPPNVPGIEGSGQVIEIGSEVTSLKKGDHVITLHGHSWSQHLTGAEFQFAKLPDGIDMAQASMLRVNPVTAWRFLHDYVALERGEWIAQNAANSGVGRCLIQIANKIGYKTVNFVRRPELIDELKALGADAVFLDTDEGHAAARELFGQTPPRLAANAVGGDSATRLIELLASEGTIVTYGAMSRRSLKVSNRHLIFKNITLRGLWVTKWLEKADHSDIYLVLHPLAEMMIAGSLRIAVDEVVPLKDFKQAIARAQSESRDGKVILDLR
jgi:trans-2-enoyl-CoA reductase